MKILLILIGVLLIWFVFRKVEIRWRKSSTKAKTEQNERMLKHEKLNELRSLKKYDENGYEKETAEAIRELNEKVNTLIERLISEGNKNELYLEIDNLKKESDSIKERMENSHKNIKNAIQEMEKKVNYIKEYLNETNFYPPEFALDNNKLSGMIVEINDRKRKNPFIDLKGYLDFSETLYNKVLEFQEQHKITVNLISKIEEKQKDFSDDKISKLMELKNDLYITLHKGEIKKTKKIIRELKKFIH